MNSRRRKALKRAQLKKEKDLKRKERIKKATSFREQLIESAKVPKNNTLEIEDCSFEEKINTLTSGFRLNLEDAMLMFSNKKGSSKFTMAEYDRYQTMIKIINQKVHLYKGNYVTAYRSILDDNTLDTSSAEYRIIKKALEKKMEIEFSDGER